MADDPRAAAFDPSVPQDERFDAQAELSKAYKPLAKALMPPADVAEVMAFIQSRYEENADLMNKASGIEVIDNTRARKPPKRGMQSVYLDGLQIFINGDTFEKPGALDFEGMNTMVAQTPILSAVVLTRQRQISRFCSISEDGGMGFEIRHLDRKHKLTGEEQNAAKLLTRFFANCGWEFNARRRKQLRRTNLTGFMLKSVRDSLTMDACPIETEWKVNRSLGLDGFTAVDGSTIRLCTESGYEGDDEYFALQQVMGRTVTAYTYDDLIYEVRNPRTDVRLAGYGFSETEMLIRTVTGFLNAMSYNIDGFDKNAIPKGLLNLTGDYASEDLSAFKRYWNATVKGINNRWTLPVMVSKDPAGKATFEKFGEDFNEMHFAKWMQFLTSLVCAIYGMSPDEINFESFSASKSTLSGSDTEEKLADSKDKGLRPLMSFYEATFSDFIVSEFNQNFCFRWVGLDAEDREQAWEGKKLILTVDELRAEQGYEKMENPMLGEAPLNPSLIALYTSQVQPPQQEQGQDFGGPPTDQGDFGDPNAVPPEDGGPSQDPQGESPAPPDGPDPSGSDDDYGQPAAAGDFGKALIYAVEG